VKKRFLISVLLMAACLLTGCAIRTVDQMYSLPKRSQSYSDLQAVLDAAMVDKTYCAPLSGEHRQPVHMADLDGDGSQEYILFAKGNGEKPLQILIFQQSGDTYFLADTVSANGSAFDLVDYVQMDDVKGVEIVVGFQLSDQVLRSVSVYSFYNGHAEKLMSTKYKRFITCDMDSDDRSELLILRPGQRDSENGIAELYSMEDGAMERSRETELSGSVDKLKRILIGKLHGGIPAVFVGNAVDESAIITDIYALVDGQFTNVSLSHESGTSVQTLRNYYVYADDIDDDGEVELPDLITMQPVDGNSTTLEQHLIRWYAMDSRGREIDKMFTYHNYVGGWYLQLDKSWASRISVTHSGGVYDFLLWNEDRSNAIKIFTVYVLTGQDREQQALSENRFVLHREASVIYAAHLEVASGELSITRDDLINYFQLIRTDWKTGEI